MLNSHQYSAVLFPALENRNYWNQTSFSRVPQTIDVDLLQQALAAAVAHHDSFRLRFVQTSSGWQQTYVDKVPSAGLRVRIMSSRRRKSRGCRKLQSSLDITHGPLITAMYFPMGSITPTETPIETPAQEPRALLLTVHHLAIDGVSWRPLLEDIESAYLALQESRPVALPSNTASYKTWSAALAAYAKRPEVQATN